MTVKIFETLGSDTILGILKLAQDTQRRQTKAQRDKRNKRLHKLCGKNARTNRWVRPCPVLKDYARRAELVKLGLTPSWREWTGMPLALLGNRDSAISYGTVR